MGRTQSYVRGLVEQGRYHFTAEEAVRGVGGTRTSVVRALHRLLAKGDLASPQRGFYVAVPPEYRSLGCLPGEQFVPQLMERAGEPYHVALLSAAQLHGAAHQRPQSFQVMLKKPRSPIECGKVRIDFYVRRNLERAHIVTMNTPRGHVRVASPETTALELVGYERHAGGLESVTTVLTELAEKLDPEILVREAAKLPLAWAQRLGFLLDLAAAGGITGPLQQYVREHARRVAPLDPSASRTGAERSRPWKIAINADIEVDL
jgi:predicted transcriptional regulator of viral defense system